MACRTKTRGVLRVAATVAVAITVALGGPSAASGASSAMSAAGSPHSVHIRSARPAYFFMVKDVSSASGMHTGEFAIVRRIGRHLSGLGGYFYSEGYCLSATLYGGTRHGTASWGPDDVVHFSERWRGSGKRQHMRGFVNVTARRMKQLSGGYVTLRAARECFS